MKSIAAALILSVVLVPTVLAQETRTLTTNESDQGLSALSVEGNVGKMQILASPSGGIRVRVDVKASDNFRRRGNPQDVDLQTSRNGSTMVIRLSGDTRDLEEIWMLEIPAQLRVQANFGVGDIDV